MRFDVPWKEKKDVLVYLWEEVGVVESPAWLEEGMEDITVRVPACSSRQQQCVRDMTER